MSTTRPAPHAPRATSGIWMRASPGWPSKTMPKKSQVSRSCQSFAG